MPAEIEAPTLERLIDQQIELGLKNPHEFFSVLASSHGEELIRLAQPYLADFVAEMARQKLNAKRRASIAKITTETLGDPEVKLRALWVPGGEQGIVYKRIADMTAEDFDARASYLERMIIGISRHASWCRTVAAELRNRNLQTARELDVLPSLPPMDDVDE